MRAGSSARGSSHARKYTLRRGPLSAPARPGPMALWPRRKRGHVLPLRHAPHCSLLIQPGGPQFDEDDGIEFSLILFSFQGMFLWESSSIHACDPQLESSKLAHSAGGGAYHVRSGSARITRRSHSQAGVASPPRSASHRQDTRGGPWNPSAASPPGSVGNETKNTDAHQESHGCAVLLGRARLTTGSWALQPFRLTPRFLPSSGLRASLCLQRLESGHTTLNNGLLPTLKGPHPPSKGPLTSPGGASQNTTFSPNSRNLF